MSETPAAVFDRLGAARPPEHPEVLFGTACVLGGSIAGLLAARVLADHAERVVVIERDAVSGQEGPRAGVPQGRHVHVLLPGGLRWIEHWFPGFTRDMQAEGAVLAGPGQSVIYRDGHRIRSGVDHLMASRPFLEAMIRARVQGLRNVSVLRAQATGLEYRGDEVCGVRYRSGDLPEVLPADMVVDAMGRASRLPDWLAEHGFDRPGLQRLPAAINYATATFKRAERPEELALTNSVARFSPPYPADGVAVAVVTAVENDRWTSTLMGYDDVRPGRTPDAFRATSAKLPPLFAEVASHDLAEIATYHQAESRHRDFAGLGHWPARLVSAGDAVASFNPTYGQGMSSAALQASCLSEYLSTGPDLHGPATGFFRLQQVVVDAAWTMSAGADAARLDALSGAEVPEEVSRRRRDRAQIMRATVVDADMFRAVQKVTAMLAHPSTLTDPALLEQAIAVNQRGGHRMPSSQS
jgi:2-polyprenyl-6-methoxyphenol hydroxylase-like FAD-dependent oxidoreductase